MVHKHESPKVLGFFSWNSIAQAAFTVVFFFWIYLIWGSTADLSDKLNAATKRYDTIFDLQVEYKTEVQDWKNLLLRSTSRDTLDKNWSAFETQYQKVATNAKLILDQNDERSILAQIHTFIDAHAANHEQYKKSVETLIRSNYDPHAADAVVRGIDRPLMDQLETAEKDLQDEKRRANESVTAQARTKIEQSLFALGFIGLLAIWMPR
jgi:methyl-accepting chemotaxis protein